MQIKNGAPPPPQTMAHKPRIVMPKSHKYKEKLSIHLPHGHVGIIAGGLATLPYGLLWVWRGRITVTNVAVTHSTGICKLHTDGLNKAL